MNDSNAYNLILSNEGGPRRMTDRHRLVLPKKVLHSYIKMGDECEVLYNTEQKFTWYAYFRAQYALPQ